MTPGSATVLVGSTLAGSTYGQSVTFTVAVSGGGPTPGGTVQFLVDGADLGSPVTLSGGDATSASTTVLGAGSHTIEADYSGDSNYVASHDTYTQVVNQAALNIIPNDLSREVGEPNPTLTYQLTGFVNGDTPASADITGSAELATTATTSSAVGKYAITVTNAGTLAAANYSFPSADFGTGTLTVTQDSATVVVGSTLPGSTYGQSVSFTVVVSGNGPSPQGTVQFLVDGTDLGSPVTLSGGSATSTSAALLGAGNHTIEADYSGNSGYAANTGTYTQVVNQAPLSIVPDNLSRQVGQPNLPLTYHFTGFVNGDTAATADITGSADLATTATTSSPAGRYAITVTDAGTLAAANYSFPSAEFGTGTLTVEPSVSTAVLSSTLPGSTYGQSVSFTVKVSGAASVPQGTVQFLVDGIDLGSPVTLSGGSATSTSTTLLGAGSHIIQADYSGDANNLASTATYTQIVNKASLTLVVDNESMVHYGPVPTLAYHYTGFVNGASAASAGITASVSLNATASSTSPAGYYPIEPPVSFFNSPNYVLGSTQAGTLTVMPAVTEVLVDFGHKSELLSALKQNQRSTRIKAIDVIFSDNVDVSTSMLHLLGVNVSKFGFSGFKYNSGTFDATWKLRKPIPAGRINLILSGEAAPPVSGAGPPISAGPYSQQFPGRPVTVRKS